MYQRVLSVSACFLLSQYAIAGVPPFEATMLNQSGQSLNGGFGIINSPFFFPNGGDGIIGLGITTNGDVLSHVEVQSFLFRDAALWSPNGRSAVLEADFEDFFSGSCASNVPCQDHVMENIFSTSVNNNGDRIYVMSLLEIGGSAEDENGVFWDVDHSIVLQGDPVIAAGLDASAVSAFADEFTYTELNDSNQLLVAMDITELGMNRRALVLFDLDANGEILSANTIAKEGGLVGAGPATWTEIGVGAHAQALNDSGSVIFSGTTSDGTAGFYRDGAFLATDGGSAPGGLQWESLVSQPVDLSNTGEAVFRGTLAPTVPFLWNEIADAGPVPTQANTTVGTGALNTINGSLDNEHDIDLYKIRVTNPAAFSASTLNGADFDTVLYLFQDGFNANGVTRSGLARNNDISESIKQSALTGQHIPVPDPFGSTYYLGVSTIKSVAQSSSINAITGEFENDEIWTSSPQDLSVHDGILYWPDPAVGSIKRVDTKTATAMSELTVSMAPNVTVLPNEEFLQPAFAIDPSTLKMYYLALSAANEIRTADLDGMNPVAFELSGDQSLSRISDIHFDPANDKLYWSDLNTGEIWQSDADGSNVVAIFDEPLGDGGTLTFDQIAIDPVNSKLYWSNPIAQEIGRSNLDGTGVQTLMVGVVAAEFAIDVAGRRLFFTETQAGRVSQLDLDTLASDVLLDSPSPVGIAHDSAIDTLYWSSSAQSVIYTHKLSTSAPTAAPGGSFSGALGSVANGGAVATNLQATQSHNAILPWFSLSDIQEGTADGPGWDAQIGDGWKSVGSAGSADLSYQISLTGAEFSGKSIAISKNNTSIVAQTSTSLPDIAPATLTVVGGDNAPVRISDSGDVAWFGRWADGGVVNERALFMNSDLLFDGDTPVTGLNVDSGRTPILDDQYSLDMSEDGQYIAFKAFNGRFAVPPLGDISIVIEFESALPITWDGPDLNKDDLVDYYDVVRFIEAYTHGDLIADADLNEEIDYQDLRAFIWAYQDSQSKQK